MRAASDEATDSAATNPSTKPEDEAGNAGLRLSLEG